MTWVRLFSTYARNKRTGIFVLALSVLGLHVNASAEGDKELLQAPLPSLSESNWQWSIPVDFEFQLSGAEANDSQGKPGTMLYPGGNGLIFLASVLTHALINSTANQVKEQSAARRANKIVAPYRELLSQLDLNSLMGDLTTAWPPLGETFLPSGNAKLKNDWLVEVRPAFVLAADARTISAHIWIAFWPSSGSDRPKALRQVQVMSTPIKAEVPESVWKQDEGKRLRATLVGLVAEGLEIGLADAFVDPALPQRSVPYTDGREDSIERGQFIRSDCGRVLLRNLRGWLMSLPARSNSSSQPMDEHCATTVRRLG